MSAYRMIQCLPSAAETYAILQRDLRVDCDGEQKMATLINTDGEGVRSDLLGRDNLRS